MALAALAMGWGTTAIARPASAVGDCVYPKTVSKPGGGLAFKRPVRLWRAPDASAANPRTLSEFSSFKIAARSKGFVQLATVPDHESPDSSKDAGRLVGWGLLEDFVLQEARNCH